MAGPVATAATPRSAFLKSFLRGLAAGGVVVALLGGWLWLDRDRTIAALDTQLARVTVTVGHAKTLDAPRATPAPPVAAKPSSQSAASSQEPLPPAPIAGLSETVADGTLPRIDAKTGQTPFKAYRRPFSPVSGKPVISLIVTDLGLSKAAFQAALAQLPPDISFGFSPYADQTDASVAAARAKGHEAWLVLPMQPVSYPRIDPGPQTLLNGAPAKDNLAKLQTLMKRASGYAGFVGSYNPMFFTSAIDALPVTTALWQRGLGLADTSQHPMAGVDPAQPYIHVDLWIDRTVNASDLADNLKLLEALAQRNGHASAVVQPLPLSYAAIRQWADSLAARGFTLGPLSAQVRH